METITDQSNLNNSINDSTIYYTREISKKFVASQTSPSKGTQPQSYVVATEHPPGNQAGNEPSLSAPTTVLPISKIQSST